MTTLDQLNRPLHDLRISVIDRCNYRCPYCMPTAHFGDHYRFLAKYEMLTFEDIERLVRIFVSLGVAKVRLTGGEPLLRPEVPKLVRQLGGIKGIEDIALTTNGDHLGAFAAELKASGLSRLTISLDAIHPKIFRFMSGDRGDVHIVLKGIEIAQACGFENIKINAVIKRGVNEGEVRDLVEYCLSHKLLLRFIEYMDVGNINGWDIKDVVTTKSLITQLSEFYDLKALQRRKPSDTSHVYEVQDRGEIGFISSVSQPFCGDCNRVRLSASGTMYTCLFAQNGIDLRQPLRDGASDEAIKGMILDAWQKRKDRYSELRAEQTSVKGVRKVEMYEIGG